jgi:AmpD protein
MKKNSPKILIDEAGFVIDATQIGSPNYDTRPHDEISLIVIHNISLPPSEYGGNGIIELFTNQLNPKDHPYYEKIYTQKVSAHFLIRRDGTLIQFVSCLARAWHAGISNWQGRERCNDFSVGIELEGSDFEPFEKQQYKTLKQLIKNLKKKYAIEYITGHADIAPGRKTDPGPFFDWSKINTSTRDHA